MPTDFPTHCICLTMLLTHGKIFLQKVRRVTMRNQVYNAVVNAINSTQSASGRSSSVSGSTRPICDLNGFDSLNAVEASCYFSASLGSEISGDLKLFYNSSGEPRTVDEIVDAVCGILQEQESA